MGAPKMELRRPQEDMPTEPGWYYGIYNGPLLAQVIKKSPKPLCIRPFGIITDACGDLVVFTGKRELPLVYFKWYGPVPTLVESCSDRDLS